MKQKQNREQEDIMKEFDNFIKETEKEGIYIVSEVAKSRLAEFHAIEKDVDAEAKRLTLEVIGTPGFGSCHTFWKHKKRILREKYHMRWRSPQDLNPETCFD
ncbi:MAG: hypothetical protein IJT12_07540 [Paludibacteraceae bacterium]|nr:hypothetical protein [Paludibacteraceae bacterium]